MQAGSRPGGRPTSLVVAKRSRQEKATLRWRSAARTAHAAGAEIGKRPKLAGAQTADASLSDFGTSDVSPSDGDSLQLQLQLHKQLQLQRSLRGANSNGNCNGRCAGLTATATATVAARG